MTHVLLMKNIRKDDTMGIYRNIFSKSKRTILQSNSLILLILPKILYACCWSRNPDFESSPTITELSSLLIRVSWLDILDDIDCVDHYYIHYWKTNGEKRNNEERIHESINNSNFFVDINLVDNTNYTLQINAFEDGSGGCGDNWSREVYFRTSKASKYLNHRRFSIHLFCYMPCEYFIYTVIE